MGNVDFDSSGRDETPEAKQRLAQRLSIDNPGQFQRLSIDNPSEIPPLGEFPGKLGQDPNYNRASMASNKTITISRLDSGKKGKDQEVLFESAGRSVESSDVISQSSMNTSR